MMMMILTMMMSIMVTVTMMKNTILFEHNIRGDIGYDDVNHDDSHDGEHDDKMLIIDKHNIWTDIQNHDDDYDDDVHEYDDDDIGTVFADIAAPVMEKS